MKWNTLPLHTKLWEEGYLPAGHYRIVWGLSLHTFIFSVHLKHVNKDNTVMFSSYSVLCLTLFDTTVLVKVSKLLLNYCRRRVNSLLKLGGSLICVDSSFPLDVTFMWWPAAGPQVIKLVLFLVYPNLIYRIWTVGMSLPSGDYFSQYSPPFFSRHCLHPGLSTTQDDCDWFKNIWKTKVIFFCIGEW